MDWSLEHAASLAHLPATVVHGERDDVCPLRNARALVAALGPSASLVFVPRAGHAASEPGTLHALIGATEAYKGEYGSKAPIVSDYFFSLKGRP